MAEIYRDYHPMEIAIRVFGSSPHTDHKFRIAEGDIILSRRTGPGIGKQERCGKLWLTVEGLNDEEMERLDDNLYESLTNDKIIFEKRRYSIPLERLKQVVPSLDLVKVKDTSLCYQPFMPIEEETIVVNTVENINTVDMPTRSTTGWVRLPIPQGTIAKNPTSDCCKVEITIHSPVGATWEWPWKTWNQVWQTGGRDALKAYFNTDKWGTIQKLMKDELAACVFGPMIAFKDSQGQPIDVNFSYTVTAALQGMGRVLTSAPPLSVHGLILDKMTMRYL